MNESAIEVKSLVKKFGALLVTDDLDFEVKQGELHAVIGPNGAGKTTLISQLAGEIKPDSGKILLVGKDVTSLPVASRARMGLVRSFQITSLCLDLTALQNVVLAVQAQLGEGLGMWSSIRYEKMLNDPAYDYLSKVGLSSRANVRAGSLAHGEQRQLELAVALACKPAVLLLDEPMAGMGREESLVMMRLLQALKSQHTIVLVEHDMDVVFALADRITVLVYGKSIASGTPQEIAANRDVQKAYLGE